MPEEAVIEARGLTKVFTDFWGRPSVRALEPLDLAVHRGEVFGILGPNGSGKTTSMKLFLGLLHPTAGEARVLGRPPQHVATKHRIGFLPEETYLYRFLTADETLDFVGRLFGMPRADRRRRADELIARFGLEKARGRTLREYSKGMVRRVGFAQALMNDPDVVFFDEPTSGLDPIASREIKDLMRELGARGKTVFASSHLLADVQDVCDRIAILHQGTLRTCGAVKDLLVVGDRTEVVLENAGPSVLDGLRRWAEAQGARVVETRPARDTLEALFLRTVGREPPTAGGLEGRP